MSNKIKVITPFYNPGDFLENCVASLMSQNYDNFHVIFIDDASTDGAFDKLPKDKDNVTIIKNAERKTALENIHNAVMNHCEPDDIVVLVDGDDWLPKKNVLTKINEFYNQHDCWFAYGQSSWTDGRKGFASAHTKEEFDNLRAAPFRVSHIRTFRAGLYHKIQEQDSDFACLKDKNGNFYKITYDVAIVLPLMEMAGFDRVKYNDAVLYIYNRSNPISDDRVNQAGQTATHVEILKKPAFKKIDTYK